SCRLAQEPSSRGAGQYHLVGAAALQPGAQSGRAHLALSAQPLAGQLGVSQPGGHHGCLRDGVEPVCQQPQSGPVALRGRLGSCFARSVVGSWYPDLSPIKATLVSGNFRRSVIRRSIASPHARSSIPENPGSPTGVFFFLTWLSVGDRQPVAHRQGGAL